jgi:hypothetical protein
MQAQTPTIVLRKMNQVQRSASWTWELILMCDQPLLLNHVAEAINLLMRMTALIE